MAEPISSRCSARCQCYPQIYGMYVVWINQKYHALYISMPCLSNETTDFVAIKCCLVSTPSFCVWVFNLNFVYTFDRVILVINIRGSWGIRLHVRRIVFPPHVFAVRRSVFDITIKMATPKTIILQCANVPLHVELSGYFSHLSRQI